MTCPVHRIKAKKSQNRPDRHRFFLKSRAPKTGMASLGNVFLTDSSGSMSLEAAMILPLFLMITAVFLSFFPAVEAELDLIQTVSDRTRVLACEEAAGEEEEEASAAMEYSFRPPFFESFLEKPVLKKTMSRRRWNGKSFGSTQEVPVYVTEYGSVYHTSLSCSYLQPKIREAAAGEIPFLRNNDGKIYYPCEYCSAGTDAETVYITVYGTRWHGNRNCAGLHRGIRRMLLSEVGGKPLCSRCREREGE